MEYILFITINFIFPLKRSSSWLCVGVMRPGEAMQSASGNPMESPFNEHFTQRKGSLQYNNRVDCCVYRASDGYCFSKNWEEGNYDAKSWDGMERFHSCSFTIGMLLDLDEGTLSVYNNDRRLGVMKRGLAGHYCWVVSIKRGSVPAS